MIAAEMALRICSAITLAPVNQRLIMQFGSGFDR